MKTKKLDKKLVLNKKTIADLSDCEMGKVQGGIDKPTRPFLESIDGYGSVCPTGCAPGDIC